MNKGQLIKKIALGIAYLLFAGFSAYFTARSLTLNLVSTDTIGGFILVYVMVLIVAIMAGYCLTVVIEEFNKRVGASKSKFIFGIVGFLLFWSISFATNVHYFFVKKHGFSILVQELTGAENFIVDNTETKNRTIEEDRDLAVATITAQVTTNIEAFEKEINNTMKYHLGFGDACINILNATETALSASNLLYGDKNTYVIYDEVRDSGDRGITQRSRLPQLQTKYEAVILESLNKKINVINKFYEKQKVENEKYKNVLASIHNLSKNHIPQVQKDETVGAYFKYQKIQQAEVIDKLPDYVDTCVDYSVNGDVKTIKIYPSSRMFDTMAVWGDLFKHRLPNGMPMIQWILISLIFDIMSYVLIALFKLS